MNLNTFRSHFWRLLLTIAGLVYVNPHVLHYTYATVLIENGESLAYVHDQLGHLSIKITVDMYGRLVPGMNKGAVDRLVEEHLGRTLYAPRKLNPTNGGDVND